MFRQTLTAKKLERSAFRNRTHKIHRNWQQFGALQFERLEAKWVLATWTGDGDGTLWSDPDNWDTDLVPVAGETVTIPDVLGTTNVVFDGTAAAVSPGSIVSDEPFEIRGSALTLSGTGSFQFHAGLSMSGGTLDGDGTVIVGTDFTWAGGTQSGTGTTRVRTRASRRGNRRHHGDPHTFPYPGGGWDRRCTRGTSHFASER